MLIKKCEAQNVNLLKHVSLKNVFRENCPEDLDNYKLFLMRNVSKVYNMQVDGYRS